MYIHVCIYMKIDLYEMCVEYRFSTYMRTDIICIFMYIYIYEYGFVLNAR